MINGADKPQVVATTPAKAILGPPDFPKGGVYRVVLRVITPVSVQKSVTVKVCDPASTDDRSAASHDGSHSTFSGRA